METDEHKIVGRAKTVLVFGSQSQQTGVISSIIVRTIENAGCKRLSFSGNVGFSVEVKDHIEMILLPMVDRITNGLGLPFNGYEISAVNIAVASINDTGIGISGFSADVPIFVAMLSAALHIPVPQSIVATGHIASVSGDITAVRAIPTKLKTAVEDDSVDTFLFSSDCSQIEENGQVIVTARDRIKVRAIDTISNTLQVVYEEEDMVLAALKEGYFNCLNNGSDALNLDENNVEVLVACNNDRFWSVLSNNLLCGKIQNAKELMKAFADYHIRLKLYPSNFGSMFFNLICAIPPAVTRLKDCFPLLETSICIELSRYAKEGDYEDVYKLLNAAGGRNITMSHDSANIKVDERDKEDGIFDEVVSQLNERAFANKYGILIDSARSSFVLRSVTVDSYEEFIDTIVSFYIHLRCYINKMPVESINPDISRNEAIQLLQSTYRKEGCELAFQGAVDGVAGGMRVLLDRLTEEYKTQQQSKYFNRVLTDALNSLQWTERVEFMRSAMKRLRKFLPDDIADEPAERFARDYEQIVKTYVESMDQFNRIISKF